MKILSLIILEPSHICAIDIYELYTDPFYTKEKGRRKRYYIFRSKHVE